MDSGELQKEEANQLDNLEFEDLEHTSQIFTQLNLLHKRGQFCDAKLIVGEHETGIHRAVLGSASPVFFDMFMRGGEEGKSQNVFKLKEFQWATFKHILNFIYTGRLNCPGERVRDVYKVSCQLRMQAVSRACAQYLTCCLTPDKCLGVRMFAQEEEFKVKVNQYVAKNIKEVTNSKKFYGLKRISIEIVGKDEDLVSKTSHDLLMPEVLNWLRKKLEATKHNTARLTEDLLVLYLNTDNSLTDCVDVDDANIENLKEDDRVQDYRKLTRMKQSGKTKPGENPVPDQHNGLANYRKFNINPDTPIKEMEWSIVASYKTLDRTYVTIVMLNGEMVTISLHYRPAAPKHDKQQDPDSPVHQNSKLFERYEELSPLEGMSTNRCAFGLTALNGSLFACGGYDRGECLKSSEVYNFEQNKWIPAANMRSPRGRFGIGIWDNMVYACGGSSGNSEVKTLECYDAREGKWKVIAEAPAIASPGIIIFQGLLYVIGGSKGQPTVATVDTFNLETKQWSSTTPMNMARYQQGVTALKNKIYVMGGTNGWKCLNEVEVFDPQSKTWSMVPPMKIARRGAGVEIYNGKIFVVGGNDGVSALSSTEIFDPETRTWSLGPTLSIPRANCGVATLNNRLFAVGGFSGKKFLNSVEFLDLENTEYWCSHLPSKYVKEIKRQSSDSGASTDAINSFSNDTSNGANGDATYGTAYGDAVDKNVVNEIKPTDHPDHNPLMNGANDKTGADHLKAKLDANGDATMACVCNGTEDLTVNGER